MPERIAIVGIGQTYHKSKRPDVNDVEMMNEAVRAALEDAQLKIEDIDAVVMTNMELGEPFRRDAMKAPVPVAGIDKADMRPQKGE